MNLYVGNLPYTTSSDDLRDLFAEYGDVTKAVVISDRETGRSKGFGFVEFADQGSGQSAIEALDGSDFGGRNLRVNEARPREDRPRGPRGGGDRGPRGGGDRRPRQQSSPTAQCFQRCFRHNNMPFALKLHICKIESGKLNTNLN